MKLKNKLFISAILFFVFTIFFQNIYALYIPNQKDKDILNHFKNKIQIVENERHYNLLNKVKKVILQFEVKYYQNNRLDYLLENIYNYIDLYNNHKYYKVIKVVDWDTIKILYNWKKTSIRLLGIDTPESYKTRFWYVECYWLEAKHFLTKLLSWQNIRIKFDSTQSARWKYNRLINYIYYNNININKLMIREGYAWEYTYNKSYKFQQLFRINQEYAKKHKLWLWAKNTCNWKRLRVGDIKKNVNDKLYDTFNSNFKINCNHYISCSEMKNCQEAKLYYNKCKWKRLDGDWNWIPCENVCKTKK